MIDIKNKNITVIGARRSGLGAARLIKKHGGLAFVSDAAKEDTLKEFTSELQKENIQYECGVNSEKVYDCALMVISPGVPSDAPVIKEAVKRGIKVISEIELAYNFCKGKIIAITGTNGKTTTTSLCDHVLNTAGVKSYAAGNIGIAFSEIADEVKENEFVSLEVSSFQIDLIDTFKPFISMILNITPDHLNRYDNKIENYISSKLTIYRNQDKNEITILNRDSALLYDNLTPGNSRSMFFSLSEKQDNGCTLEGNNIVYRNNGVEQFTCTTDDISLKGEHNYANAMAVIIAAKIIGIEDEKIKAGLKSFAGVEHRLEFVREIDGVKFINDSKATNVDSVWYALRSFDQPMFLILGGQDKGNDYNQIKDLVQERVKKIYAIGSSADKIFNFFHKLVKVEIKKSMKDVIHTANAESRSGDVVLLSPACASYDMFDNYEHRGKVFKDEVNKL